MSLLHQESPEEIDDAARGEAFTKGSSHVVWASLIAIVLVTIAVGIYVMAGQRRPVATGEIVQVWAHPRHVVSSGLDANGASMAQESFDQVLLFAHVKLQNQSKYPLVLQNILINTKLNDGVLSVSAGSVAQYEEVFVAYPELAGLHSNALSPRTTIAPGESVDGAVFWALRLSKEEWDARKDWAPDAKHRDPGSKFGLNFSFVFQYQPSVTLAPHTAVIEQ
jgi:hypothetical protein